MERVLVAMQSQKHQVTIAIAQTTFEITELEKQLEQIQNQIESKKYAVERYIGYINALDENSNMIVELAKADGFRNKALQDIEKKEEPV